MFIILVAFRFSTIHSHNFSINCILISTGGAFFRIQLSLFDRVTITRCFVLGWGSIMNNSTTHTCTHVHSTYILFPSSNPVDGKRTYTFCIVIGNSMDSCCVFVLKTYRRSIKSVAIHYDVCVCCIVQCQWNWNVENAFKWRVVVYNSGSMCCTQKFLSSFIFSSFDKFEDEKNKRNRAQWVAGWTFNSSAGS